MRFCWPTRLLSRLYRRKSTINMHVKFKVSEGEAPIPPKRQGEATIPPKQRGEATIPPKQRGEETIPPEPWPGYGV